MSEYVHRPPARLGEAIALLRATLAESERRTIPPEVTLWAMTIEAIDRLVKLHGAHATAGMLQELARITRETERTGGQEGPSRLS